jgi:threonine/homoserine/homoserine lactone efflux protein
MLIPIDSLIGFVIASALLSIAPGPDNLFVLMQSALYGKMSGVFVTLGLCTGLIVHTAAVAFGVAAIFQTSVVAFTVLKIVGALYLAYMAWQAFCTSRKQLKTSSSNLRTIGAL